MGREKKTLEERVLIDSAVRCLFSFNFFFGGRGKGWGKTNGVVQLYSMG